MRVKNTKKFIVNKTLFHRFIEVLRLVKEFRLDFYPELIQITYNNNRLLATVVEELLNEGDELLISFSKHIQNLICYGITIKGDQRYTVYAFSNLSLYFIID